MPYPYHTQNRLRSRNQTKRGKDRSDEDQPMCIEFEGVMHLEPTHDEPE